MKKTNLLFTIAMMIVASFVVFVSCKKDNENTLNPKDYDIQQPADIRQIDDLYSYFKDFKTKLTESKSNEAYNLEDAAWHLASLANLDFCNINVAYDEVRFDTIEMHVNVTDNLVTINELSAAYNQMYTAIQQFKKSVSLNGQNLYFINMSINAEGNAKIALMTTIDNDSKYTWTHLWYFDDEFILADTCDNNFSEDSTYTWNTTAARELQRVLNLFDHMDNHQIGHGGNTMNCYIPTRNHDFDYNITDPYYSGYYNESRVFAKRNQLSTLIYIFSSDDLMYCLDSYLNLGYNFINDHLYTNERPVNWKIYPTKEKLNTIWNVHYHKLHVEYGRPVGNTPID